MERNETRGSDHAVYIVVSIVILGLLAYFASQSVIVVHRVELPVLQAESNIFGYCLSDRDYEIESQAMKNIRDVLDAEFAKRHDYSAIKTDVLRKVIKDASARTRNCTCIVTCVLMGFLGSIVIIGSVKARNRLYERRENIHPFQQKGIEGFVRLVGTYLGPDMVRQVRKSPTPQNLADAFHAVRERTNIPCSVAARLFPRETKERMILLEYGKAKVRFAENSGDNRDIP